MMKQYYTKHILMGRVFIIHIQNINFETIFLFLLKIVFYYN